MSTHLPECKVWQTRLLTGLADSFCESPSPTLPLFLPRELGCWSLAGNRHCGLYYEICPIMCLAPGGQYVGYES